MKNRIAFAFLIAAASLGLTAPGLHAQTLRNGSFENPTLAPASAARGNGDNWTTTGPTFVIANGGEFPSTPYGNQVSQLEQGSTSAQTISGFTLNRPYTLSLAAAGNRANSVLTINITGGATASLSFTPVTESGSTINFATYSLAFTPTNANPVTITFSASGDFSYVDNVQLAAAAPEPSTCAALAAGVGLLGIVSLRRLRAAR